MVKYNVGKQLLWLVAFCATSTLTLPAGGASTDACVTPNGVPGECKTITNCPSVIGVLQRQPLTTDDMAFLNGSRCGWDGLDAKVCCGFSATSHSSQSQMVPNDKSEAPGATIIVGNLINTDNIREGSDIYFKCIIDNEPMYNVEWKHNGRPVQPSIQSGVVVGNQSLFLQQITRTTSGNYTCVAYGPEGSGESRPFTVTVKDKEMDTGIITGIDPGINTGIGPGIDTEIDPGINTGMNTEKNTGINAGIDTEINTEKRPGINTGIGTGIPTGTGTGMSTGMDIESNNLLPNTSQCGYDSGDRLIGQAIALIDQFAWTALLEYEKENEIQFLCEGALINKRYILTAAHCITGNFIPKSWKLRSVRLGEYNLPVESDCEPDLGVLQCLPPPLQLGIQEKIFHEEYNPDDMSQRHDIALLRLRRDVVLNDQINPICLPRTEDLTDTFTSNSALLTSGWGTADYQFENPIKLSTRVVIQDNQECASAYRAMQIRIGRSQICTLFRWTKDKCKIASGGTLMAINRGEGYHYAAGVLTFPSVPCIEAHDIPNVYTKVADYMPWILSKLKP